MGKVVRFPLESGSVAKPGQSLPEVVQVKFIGPQPDSSRWQECELVDYRTGDALLRAPIRQIGEFLNRHGYQYALGSRALWYIDFMRLAKRRIKNVETNG